MARNHSERKPHRTRVLAYAKACDEFIAGRPSGAHHHWWNLPAEMRIALRHVSVVDDTYIRRRAHLKYIRKHYGS